ncbi:hypothetical protein M3193_02170 [Sporosarcina luteola]|uniref:hypothetical protein n=1 Tax=Sporosarcina luteola TaxID=582850 RepID=UPI00203C55C4|nr:hypothetical protein [Sporosarcina luteola]MCM3742938.1 hypothetical protein [Sporosarcina luteola]
MILRHLTTKDKYKEILKAGCLIGSNNMRKDHKGYVSFELFNQSFEEMEFKKVFAVAKNTSVENVVQLLFDGNQMQADGIEILENFKNGIKHSKVELTLYPIDFDINQIGEYRFVYGNVSLEYLIT